MGAEDPVPDPTLRKPGAVAAIGEGAADTG
jgi:hypothetical protein